MFGKIILSDQKTRGSVKTHSCTVTDLKVRLIKSCTFKTELLQIKFVHDQTKQSDCAKILEGYEIKKKNKTSNPSF